MTDMITIVGTPISPYVRKVLAILDMKAIPFRCDPQIPFFGGDDFTAISPLRRVPVLIQGNFTLPDSSAIVQYIEDQYPDVSAFPGDAQARARARWFEEYADDHFGRNVIFGMFFERIVKPRILKKETDLLAVERAEQKEMPKALDYLETQLDEDRFLVGDISVADFGMAAMMKNAFWSGWALDESRWPHVSAWLARVNAHPSMAKVNALGDDIFQAHPKQYTDILKQYHAG